MAYEKMNAPDAFEHALRNSLESYEVPYNSADWSQLERELDKGSGATRSTTAALIALLFGGTLALATTTYVVLDQYGTGMANKGPSAAAMLSSTTDEVAVQPIHQEEILPSAPTGTSTSPARADLRTNPAQGTVLVAKDQQPQDGNDGTAVVTTIATAANTSEIGIRASISEGCPGSTVEFVVQNAPDQKDVLWNFGDGSFSTAKSPTHVFSKAGKFEVVLSHSSFLDKPVSSMIVIHEIPEAAFSPMVQTYPNTIPNVHFENHSMGGESYLWDFGDGSTSTLRLPNHVYKESGAYTVSLVVTNAAGCTDRSERSVRIEEDYNLNAAKTFSPDGDGVEDDFIPAALPTLGLKFRMTVHDPVSGQLVYETTDAKRPWNGRIGGRGEFSPSGEYVWMVEMKDGDKVGGTYTGTVELIR